MTDPTEMQDRIAVLEAERDKLLWLVEGLCAAIDTGRNEPLVIWREQAEIAGVAPHPRAALKGEGATND